MLSLKGNIYGSDGSPLVINGIPAHASKIRDIIKRAATIIPKTNFHPVLNHDETIDQLNKFFTTVINAIAENADTQNRNQEARLVKDYGNSHDDAGLAKEFHKMEETARQAIHDMSSVSGLGLRPGIWLEESTDLQLHDFDGIVTTDDTDVDMATIFKAKCNHVNTYVARNRKNLIKYASDSARKVKDMITGAKLVSKYDNLLHDFITNELAKLEKEITEIRDMCEVNHEEIKSFKEISNKIYELYMGNTEVLKSKLSEIMKILKDVSLAFMHHFYALYDFG